MGQSKALRPLSEPLSPRLCSKGLAQSLAFLGVFLLKAAWASGWQEKSREGTPSAHLPALGSGPQACLTCSESCLLICPGSPSWRPFSRETHAFGVPQRSLCRFDTEHSVCV